MERGDYVQITLYLLRDKATFAKATLRNHHLFVEHGLVPPPDSTMKWRLFVRRSFEHEASWFGHLSPIMTAEDVERVTTKSAGAVLLIHVHERVFAVTFGTGFHAVDHALVEPDFGLRVAANCIDVNGLTLADARGLGKGKRNATSRLAQPGEMFALGLLTDEEWIRRFGGDVNIPGFARSAKGADSLQLSLEDGFGLGDLSAKLRQALDLYQADTYRDSFPFLDYFRRESDKETLKELDGLIAEAMRQRDQEIGFAVPDDVGLTADTYRLCHSRRRVDLRELRTEDVYNAIDTVNGWANPLHLVKVEALNLSGEEVRAKEELRRYVVASAQRVVADGHQDYAITAGAWFRVHPGYAKTVDRYLADSIPDITDELGLPQWDDEYLEEHVEGKYGEDRYNRYTCDQRGYALLDRDFYRGQAGERVEICDQLTPDKKLICVKRMDGSDKMSHLFQQGSVSAQMIMGNPAYRAKLMAKLRELDPAAEFGNATDWTIVYAVATSKPGDLKQIMYFFSRAALRSHAQTISVTGIRVAMAKIDRK